MPTPTYTPLANITLGSSAASVTFSSISQSYRDLVLVINHPSMTVNNPNLKIRFNGDSGANYNTVQAYADGSTAASLSNTNNTEAYFGISTTDPSQWAVSIGHIMDYSVTDKHKTLLTRGSNALAYLTMSASRWASTAAITSLAVSSYGAGSFTAGSTFALYGIAS